MPICFNLSVIDAEEGAKTCRRTINSDNKSAARFFVQIAKRVHILLHIPDWHLLQSAFADIKLREKEMCMRSVLRKWPTGA